MKHPFYIKMASKFAKYIEPRQEGVNKFGSQEGGNPPPIPPSPMCDYNLMTSKII